MPGPLEGCLRRWIQLCTLSWEDPLEKGKATNSSILAWRIPWTVTGSKRVRHNWETFTFTYLFFTLIKSALVELAENVDYAYYMGSGIGSSSWQWQILCALRWQNLLCVSSPCMGSPCPECPRKPCFLLCLPFFFLPFPHLHPLLLASFSAFFLCDFLTQFKPWPPLFLGFALSAQSTSTLSSHIEKT